MQHSLFVVVLYDVLPWPYECDISVLQSSYWCGSKPTKSEAYESRKGEEDKHFEREPTDFEACIRICNLTKVSANTDIKKTLWEHYLSFLFSIVHSLSLILHSFLPFLFRFHFSFELFFCFTILNNFVIKQNSF